MPNFNLKIALLVSCVFLSEAQRAYGYDCENSLLIEISKHVAAVKAQGSESISIMRDSLIIKLDSFNRYKAQLDPNGVDRKFLAERELPRQEAVSKFGSRWVNQGEFSLNLLARGKNESDLDSKEKELLSLYSEFWIWELLRLQEELRWLNLVLNDSTLRMELFELSDPTEPTPDDILLRYRIKVENDQSARSQQLADVYSAQAKIKRLYLLMPTLAPRIERFLGPLLLEVPPFELPVPAHKES